MYGMMHITGDAGGNPVKPGVAVTDVLTGGGLLLLMMMMLLLLLCDQRGNVRLLLRRIDFVFSNSEL